jgi:hypothetical protein
MRYSWFAAASTAPSKKDIAAEIRSSPRETRGPAFAVLSLAQIPRYRRHSAVNKLAALGGWEAIGRCFRWEAKIGPPAAPHPRVYPAGPRRPSPPSALLPHPQLGGIIRRSRSACQGKDGETCLSGWHFRADGEIHTGVSEVCLSSMTGSPGQPMSNRNTQGWGVFCTIGVPGERTHNWAKSPFLPRRAREPASPLSGRIQWSILDILIIPPYGRYRSCKPTVQAEWGHGVPGAGPRGITVRPRRPCRWSTGPVEFWQQSVPDVRYHPAPRRPHRQPPPRRPRAATQCPGGWVSPEHGTG